MKLELIFKAKVQLEYGTQKIQMATCGSHLESDVTENQLSSAYGHN